VGQILLAVNAGLMTVLIMADTDLVSDGGALNGVIGRLQRQLFLEAENETVRCVLKNPVG
jgi:hypothetical protein